MGRYGFGDLPGWGDMGHPDEWDDGKCEECGQEDCSDDCECRERCFPHVCYVCEGRMRDEDFKLEQVDPKYGEPICDTCWNIEATAADLDNVENWEAKDWDDGSGWNDEEDDSGAPF